MILVQVIAADHLLLGAGDLLGRRPALGQLRKLDLHQISRQLIANDNTVSSTPGAAGAAGAGALALR